MQPHRPINGLGRVLDMLAVLKTGPAKALYLLAQTNSHLESLEAQQTACHQALVKILSLMDNRRPSPPQKVLHRLTSPTKLLTQLVMKKLQMGGVS